jgi:hypothetical protein
MPARSNWGAVNGMRSSFKSKFRAVAGGQLRCRRDEQRDKLATLGYFDRFSRFRAGKIATCMLSELTNPNLFYA